MRVTYSGSDVEARILEIEVALDDVHHVVVDPSLAPEVDDRAPLRVEQLAAQPLIVLRLLLDRAVILSVEPGAETGLPEPVEVAHALGGGVANPVLAGELVQSRDRGVGRVDTRL